MTKDYYSDDHTIQVGKETNEKTLKIKSKLAVISYDGTSEYITVDESGNVELSGATTTISSEDGTVSLSDHLDVAVPAPLLEPPSGESIFTAKYAGTTVLSIKGKTEGVAGRYAETKLPIKGSKTYHAVTYKPNLESLGVDFGTDPVTGVDCVKIIGATLTSDVYLPLEVPSGCIPTNLYFSCATSATRTVDISGRIVKVVEDKTTGQITTSLAVPITETAAGPGNIFIEKDFSQLAYYEAYREYESSNIEISFYLKIKFHPSHTNSFFIRYWKVSWV